MRQSDVTAIIPTCNAGHLVVQAVESVLAQTSVPSQIIVVDDGSIDGTDERLAAYRQHVQYLRQPNQGVSVARNRGIAAARNAIVAFLDADDVWHPCKIEIQREALARHPDVGLLGTKSFEWPAAVFPQLPSAMPPEVESMTWRDLAVRSRFATSTVMIRRQVLENVGAFDPELRRAEDRDLYIRAGKAAPVGMLGLPLTGARPSATSLSRQVATMREGGERLLTKLRNDPVQPIDWLLWRQAASYLDYNCANTCEVAGHRLMAVGYLLRSLAGYPLHFSRGVMPTPFGRTKRLLVLLFRLLLKRPYEHPGKAYLPEGDVDALEALKRGFPVAV